MVGIFGGNAIYGIDILEPPAFQENCIHWVLEALCICLSFVSDCLCLCICLFVSLCLGHCHRQMISFQKIYGLYGLQHHTVEINGDVTVRTDGQLKVIPIHCLLHWSRNEKTGHFLKLETNVVLGIIPKGKRLQA